jgi:hypothetical protein
MTRFAWLQSRAQTLTTLALLAALAVAALITGIQLSHLYNNLLAHCTSGCGLATNQFLSHEHFMQQTLDILGRAVPALFGIFWGAPLLARELETGTYRVALTQSVSRSRWLLTKLAVVGLATAILAGLLTVTITWWWSSYHGLSTEPFEVFDRRDIAPVGYAVFAVALGALAGVVIRRTVPAMAATLGGFVIARVVISTWVRPHLMSPIHKALSVSNAGPASSVQFGLAATNGSTMSLFAKGVGPPNSWTISSHLVTGSGHVASSSELTAWVHQHCSAAAIVPPPLPSGRGGVAVPQPGGAAADAARACVNQAAQTFHLLVAYQPADRYWTFQWLETGIFVGLAIICAATCYWWVTRRVS